MCVCVFRSKGLACQDLKSYRCSNLTATFLNGNCKREACGALLRFTSERCWSVEGLRAEGPLSLRRQNLFDLFDLSATFLQIVSAFAHRWRRDVGVTLVCGRFVTAQDMSLVVRK